MFTKSLQPDRNEFHVRFSLFSTACWTRCESVLRILDLVSEIGEVSKEVLKMTDYGQKPPEPRAETKSELGDVFFSLIVAANLLNIDLEEALEEVLKKYSQRLDKGDSPDSENS